MPTADRVSDLIQNRNSPRLGPGDVPNRHGSGYSDSVRATAMNRTPILVMLTLALAATLPAIAQAQDRSESVSSVEVDGLSLLSANADTEAQKYVINIEDCESLAANPDDKIEFTWNFDTPLPDDGLFTVKLVLNSESCSESSLTYDAATEECQVLLENESLSGSTVRFEIGFASLTGVSSVAECASNADVIDVMMIFTDFNEDDTSDSPDRDELRIEFDTDRPAAPTDLTAKAGQSQIVVSWSEVAAASSYTLYYGTDPIPDGADPSNLTHTNVSGTSTTQELDEGITINTYYLAVVTKDSVGNLSAVSEVVTVTTQPVEDFYEYYRGNGGTDEGGYCATANPVTGGLWFIALLMAPLLYRRRRKAVATVVAALLMVPSLLPQDASAQSVESPITGELEIKFGEYAPAIDAALGESGTPYETIFGSGGGFYFEIEYDHFLWREFGSLAIGFSFGYSSVEGKGLLSSGEASVDDTSLNILPLRSSLVYRFDLLEEEFSIPLVPYMKAGLDYYLWWINSAAGIATYRNPDTSQLDEGRGGTFGWHAGAGVKFLLDVLAPTMSRGLDVTAGINDSYLFAEWLMAEVDDFGSDASFDFSDSTFLFGLAFEF